MTSDPARRLSLALDAAALLSQVGREHPTSLDRRFAAFGLTAQQAALLLHAGSAPTSPSKLTDALGTDTAGMTRLLDRLEAKDLISRHRTATDRRAVLIEITEKGRALLPRLPMVFGQINGQLFADFDDDELEQLTTLCQRMRTNLRTATNH